MPPADPVIDPQTAARLRGMVSRLSRGFNRSATGAGLTPAQVSALGIVVHRGPLSLSELTRIEALNPTMVSRVVGRLEELALLVRSADPGDQRAVIVEATPEGQRTSRALSDERAAVLQEALLALEPADRELVLAALPAFERLEAEVAARGGRG